VDATGETPAGVASADAHPVPGARPSRASETASDPQDLRDQHNRLWEHGLHQDQEFVSRSNFFLVAESLLAVAYSSILTKSVVGRSGGLPFRLSLAAKVLAVFGLLLTVIWAYSNNRLRHTSMYLKMRAYDALPEFRRTLDERKLPGRRISATWMITFVVPGLAAIMWLIFLFIAW
jgi:hypothetical protein